MVCGINDFRQIVRPLAGFPLRFAGNSQFRLQRMNLSAGIKEMGNDFITSMKIFSAQLTGKLRCPEGTVLSVIAGTAKIDVNGLIKTICRIGDFPDGINNLITGTLWHIT